MSFQTRSAPFDFYCCFGTWSKNPPSTVDSFVSITCRNHFDSTSQKPFRHFRDAVLCNLEHFKFGWHSVACRGSLRVNHRVGKRAEQRFNHRVGGPTRSFRRPRRAGPGPPFVQSLALSSTCWRSSRWRDGGNGGGAGKGTSA